MTEDGGALLKVTRVEICDADAGWKLIGPLEADVYTPAVLAAAPWRDVVWSHADLRAIVWREDDPIPVAHVGLYFRDGLGDGRPQRLGGIGGVMTRTNLQGRGFASAAMAAAEQALRQAGDIDLGVLFCEPRLAPFYVRRGWRPLAAPVFVDQPAGRQQFTVAGAMVLELAGRAPAQELDLCGRPW